MRRTIDRDEQFGTGSRDRCLRDAWQPNPRPTYRQPCAFVDREPDSSAELHQRRAVRRRTCADTLVGVSSVVVASVLGGRDAMVATEATLRH